MRTTKMGIINTAVCLQQNERVAATKVLITQIIHLKCNKEKNVPTQTTSSKSVWMYEDVKQQTRCNTNRLLSTSTVSVNMYVQLRRVEAAHNTSLYVVRLICCVWKMKWKSAVAVVSSNLCYKQISLHPQNPDILYSIKLIFCVA